MSPRKKRIIISIGFLVVLYGILILVFIVLPEAKEERSVVKAVVTETKEQERILLKLRAWTSWAEPDTL